MTHPRTDTVPVSGHFSVHMVAIGPGEVANEPQVNTQWETVQKADAEPRYGEDWSLSLLFVCAAGTEAAVMFSVLVPA